MASDDTPSRAARTARAQSSGTAMRATPRSARMVDRSRTRAMLKRVPDALAPGSAGGEEAHHVRRLLRHVGLAPERLDGHVEALAHALDAPGRHSAAVRHDRGPHN